MTSSSQPATHAPGSAREILALVETQADLGTWILDLSTFDLKWSLGLYGLLEVSPSEVTPSFDAFVERVHEEDRPPVSRVVTTLLDGELRDCKFRLVTSTGALRWVKSNTKLISSSGSRPSHVVGTVVDVTERQMASEREERSARRIELLSDLLGGSSWTTRPDGSGLENPGWRRITGQSREEHVGWGRIDAVHPADRNGFREAWRSAVADAKAYRASYRVRTQSGTFERYTSLGNPLRGPNGDIEGWSGIMFPDPDGFGASLFGAATCPQQPPIEGAHIRAARALLGWSAEELSRRAGLSLSTVRRIEGDAMPSVRSRAMATLRRVLEEAGAEIRPLPGGKVYVALAPGPAK